jgi:hypothetical protein
MIMSIDEQNNMVLYQSLPLADRNDHQKADQTSRCPSETDVEVEGWICIQTPVTSKAIKTGEYDHHQQRHYI